MPSHPHLVSTGNAQLDAVLRGGLPRDALHLVQGAPGSGKTTLALQFLLDAASKGETALYVTLSESREEIDRIAASHGWSLDSLHIFEFRSLMPGGGVSAQQTLFHPAEVELQEVTKPILDEVERVKPANVVIDSLSEFRLISGDLLRFRRQILSLKRFFSEHRCTVMMLDDRTADVGGSNLLASLSHGVLTLDKESPDYGRTRRRISVEKMRGVAFSEGFHDLRIETGRVAVYPRLVAAEHRESFAFEPLPSGVAGLDLLLCGGPDRGTSTLVIGPAGTGKSSIAAQFCVAAAGRGERAAMFLFDETIDTMLARSRSLGLPVKDAIDSGRLVIRHLDPAELTAGEFTDAVRQATEADQARVIVIDSLGGYLDSVPNEKFLTMHLRELLTFLNQRGVATFMVLAQHGMTGSDAMRQPLDVSYLADNVILLRYFEASGAIRKAISILKKRSGPHESTIREFQLGSAGLVVGEPLREFEGVLTGVPRYVGQDAPLLRRP